jgi:DNA modification methylase
VKPYVADSDFTLYNTDAREGLAQLEPGTVQTIVTSPPYFLLRDYGDERQIGHEASLDEYVAALVGVFHVARNALTPDGTLWLNLGDTHSAAPRGSRHSKTSRLSTPERQERVSVIVNKRGRAPGVKPKDLFLVPFEVARALREDGWWLRQTVIWDKTNTIPESAKDRPTTSHEYLFLLSKASRYYYDADAIAEPATWERWGNQTNGKHRGNLSSKASFIKDRTKDELASAAERKTRNARSVWRGNCAQFAGDHAAVMPDWLAERCILAATRPGDVVLDPFAGAGTTALAARGLERRSIGLELSAASCAIAADRLRQLSLLAG